MEDTEAASAVETHIPNHTMCSVVRTYLIECWQPARITTTQRSGAKAF